ncbi:Protein kinase-like domain [Pseudocohnilembus persalinus]|uniref:non-specific serine/threonine protein kinase n=1 Tax=Pseudocohnilembus persalinus TaxID=266149 RepID=A0A0V0R7E2_PSEPJ|nr:Protein kinase-like domain [Pseudocohnilembus persalinus]|eukprot:KRX10272.1 Protein kinase-like domain [Pseudocohnilembus persalinus]
MEKISFRQNITKYLEKLIGIYNQNYFYSYEIIINKDKLIQSAYDQFMSKDQGVVDIEDQNKRKQTLGHTLKIYFKNEMAQYSFAIAELLEGSNQPISIDILKKNVQYVGGYNENSITIKLLWNILQNDFTQQEIEQLFYFITAQKKLPANGSQGFICPGQRKIKIYQVNNINNLPVSHTCNLVLELPCYKDKNQMIKKIKQAIVVLEYIEGGDLQGFIQKYRHNKNYVPEKDVWEILIQISYGLKYMHEQNIVHRDLKSANVLFDQKGKIYKICDFNSSKICSNNNLNTIIGTPYYTSPEIWWEKPYDAKVDMWSLGCIIYEICAQRPPFVAESRQSLIKQVKVGKFEQIPEFYSEELKSIVSSLLKVNPNERPSSCNKY